MPACMIVEPSKAMRCTLTREATMSVLTGGASVPDRDSADILNALNKVANDHNFDAAAIAGVMQRA